MAPPEQTVAGKLAEFYARVRPETLPDPVVARSRRVVADTLANLAVGYREGRTARIIGQYLTDLGGAPEATVLGLDRKLPALNAALAMGALAHSVELDDGHRWGTSHPAVAVVPAALAVAEREGCSFADLLAAIAIGYDAMLRSARAINPEHLKRGFHSTGTCGSIGAAAACAALLRLTPEQTAYALSLGGLQSAGLQEMLHDHPGIKVVQPGKAALAGVLAADLVRRGAASPRTIYEGPHGWLKAMCGGEYSPAALTGDLGSRWEIMCNYIKLYPTCQHCHAAIDLAREARAQLACTPADIAAIDVRTYSLGYAEVGQIICPATPEEALFSLPFAVAIALLTGNVTLQDYTPERLRDARLRELAEKVAIAVDERMDAVYPEERGCAMTVTCHDGRRFAKSVPLARGEPETPVSDDELMLKHAAMLAPYYRPDLVEGIWQISVRAPLPSARYTDLIELFRRLVGP